VIGTSDGQDGYSSRVPEFVSWIIERGLSAGWKVLDSFSTIFTSLEIANFNGMEGVGIKKVSDFVNWIEQ
jgi:hypothetical protein